MAKFEEGDYYLENGKVIFTDQYLKRRGLCCGNGCRHCPYEPKNAKGSIIIKNEKS